MWELRGEGTFWSFVWQPDLEGWGAEEGFSDPSAQGRRPRASVEPPALAPRFSRAEPWWGEEIEVLWSWGVGDSKDKESPRPV